MMEIHDIGSARIACRWFGSGKRTFVIDTALCTCSAEWWHIAEHLGRHGRVLVYDRAGYGESSVSLLERTPANIATELKKLIDQIATGTKITLIGHSQGGLCAVQFALQYPELVDGLILLDPATPFDSEFNISLSPTEYKQSGVDKTASLRLGKWITTAGLGFVLKPLLRRSPPFYYREFSAEAETYLLRNLCKRSTYQTALAEYAFSHEPLQTSQIAKAVSDSSLKDLPIRLITHSSDFYRKELEQFGGMDPKTAEKVESLWQQIMTKFLLLSKESKHITAPQSGHFIHLTDENLLIRVAEENLHPY